MRLTLDWLKPPAKKAIPIQKHEHEWRAAKLEDFPNPNYPPKFLWEMAVILWCDGCKHWKVMA